MVAAAQAAGYKIGSKTINKSFSVCLTIVLQAYTAHREVNIAPVVLKSADIFPLEWSIMFGSYSPVVDSSLPLWFATYDNVQSLTLGTPFGG